MDTKTHNIQKVPQLKWAGLYGLYALPAAWWLAVMYLITPRLLPWITTTAKEINGWALNLITLSCYVFEFLLALMILRREGQDFKWQTLKSRLNLRWGSWKTRGIFLLIFLVAFFLTLPLMSASRQVAGIAPPPEWFPASQNPLKEVGGLQDALPGVSLPGNYGFLLLFLFTGLMNVVGEDTLYRGVLIPKLQGLFGNYAWMAGGVLFSLKHVYVWWRMVEVLPLGIAGAFLFGPMGSLPLALLAHFLGNYGMTWPLVIMEVVFG
jgi:membrane protease YdiL (CAAX protease family)